MNGIELKTTNQKQTAPTNSPQKTTNQPVQIPVPPLTGSVGSGAFLVGGGRVVVGSESYWREFFSSLSKADLERFELLRRESYFARFNVKRRKGHEKCRNVYRVFSDSDLVKFFSVIPVNEVKFEVVFFSMLTAGFRIGEAVRVKASDVDFERGIVSLLTEKANVRSDQPIPRVLCEVLSEWIASNQELITKNNGYLFFSENAFADREVVSELVAKNYFGKYRKASGLNQSYAEASDSKNQILQANRPLYKLTSHSLRRTYLTRTYEQRRDKELVRVLARHRKETVTDSYIFFSHSEQLVLVNECFSEREPFQSIAKTLIEKIRLKQQTKRAVMASA